MLVGVNPAANSRLAGSVVLNEKPSRFPILNGNVPAGVPLASSNVAVKLVRSVMLRVPFASGVPENDPLSEPPLQPF
jgi:hypothetical protein